MRYEELNKDRRRFLKGAFGGVTAAGLLIVGPDVGAFAECVVPGEDIVCSHLPPAPFEGVDIGNILFNYKGEPVAVITDIKYDIPQLDVTRYGSFQREFVPGAPNITLRATVRGPVNINART